LWPDDDRVLLEEELRGVSWLATLAPLLAETSSAGLAELLTGIPSSKGRGTSGGDVQRIRAQFTPARQTQKEKIKDRLTTNIVWGTNGTCLCRR